MFEKLKTGTKNERPYSRDLGDVVAYLASEQQKISVKGIEQAPRECHLQRTVTPQKLRSLEVLDFEVMISDHDNGLSLYTGQEGASEPLDLVRNNGSHAIENLTRTNQEARFTLHNHPNFTSSPSGGDIHASLRRKSEIEFILGKDGISFHKTRDFLKADAVDFHFTRDLRRKYAPQFVLNSDMRKRRIDGFVAWDDPRIEVICNYINDEHGKWQQYVSLLEK